MNVRGEISHPKIKTTFNVFVCARYCGRCPDEIIKTNPCFPQLSKRHFALGNFISTAEQRERSVESFRTWFSRFNFFQGNKNYFAHARTLSRLVNSWWPLRKFCP